MDCQYCSTPTKPPFALCRGCRRDYAQTIHQLRKNLQLLRSVARHEYTISDHGTGGKPSDPPAPVNLHALDMIDETEDLLQDTCVDAGFTWLDTWPRLTLRMLRDMGTLCRAPHAGQCMRRIQRENERIQPYVDRRPRTRRIIGHCPECGHEITAGRGEQWRICPECTTLVSVAEARETATREVDRYHLTRTPAGLAEWLKTEYGVEVGRKQVTDWIRRGKLPSTRPVDGEPGYWEFSLREVLAVALGHTA